MKIRQDDLCFMERALMLARRGQGFVSPNPLVGAVFVRNGKIIAEGFHERFGSDHAEITAIADAEQRKIRLTGSTLYVNLEPCVLFVGKKTPGCIPAIIKSGVARVMIALRDPNPKVSGRGIHALKNAGISVETGCLEESARELNEKYCKWISTGMPFIGMKVAMSLDGKIAAKTGDSKWITSEESRDFVRSLRDSYDAVLIGIETVLADNPELRGKKREPVRIILDAYLRIPDRARVLRNSNVIIATTALAPKSKISALRKKGVKVLIFETRKTKASLLIAINPLLRLLGKTGVSSIFVEGGAEIFGSFIDARAVDAFYWFIAPKIIGGRLAKPAVSGEGISRMTQALQLQQITVKPSGSDFLFIGRRAHGASAKRAKNPALPVLSEVELIN